MRNPQVAGSFYTSEPAELKSQVKRFLSNVKCEQGKSLFAIAPHAGHEYSGQTAAYTYSALEKADTYIIIGPNHRGMGHPAAVSMQDAWYTPLGPIEVDRELAAKICREPTLEPDEDAHELEHSIEVQLPFLQERSGKFKIVPISLAASGDPKEMLGFCSRIADSISKSVKESKKKIAIIASSDFSHFLPKETAERLDLKAIAKIKTLSAKEFLESVLLEDLSICGFAPITVLMLAAGKLGAKKGKLLHYTTSADTTGDPSSVVAYASLILV